MKIIEKNEPYISEYEINMLARMMLPQIQAFYESEEGQKALKEWQDKNDK